MREEWEGGGTNVNTAPINKFNVFLIKTTAATTKSKKEGGGKEGRKEGRGRKEGKEAREQRAQANPSLVSEFKASHSSEEEVPGGCGERGEFTQGKRREPVTAVCRTACRGRERALAA